jgi:hypothetical protein
LTLKPKFQHDSSWKNNTLIPDFDPTNDYRVSQEGMGGYRFPILDDLGAPYVVTIHRIPENAADLKVAASFVRGTDIALAYVDTNKLVTVQSEGKIANLGLNIFTTDANSKTIKRAKTLVRPFRVFTRMPELRVLRVSGGAELDGAGIISERIYEEALMNVQLGYWNPVQRASIIHWLERQRINNCRFVGKLIDVRTGEALNAFGKGNFVVAPTPEGVDIITSDDNLKHEVTGDGHAWALFEPQGSKDAWEDQQTYVNQGMFMMSIPEARERMKDNAAKALDDLQSGKVMSSVVELAKSDFHKEYAWDDNRFFKELRWNANSIALHGLSYTISPWLTERLGRSWISSLSINDPRKIRIKIPCAVRCQVVSQALVNLAGIDIEVEAGTLRWCEDLKVLVANDVDWVDTIIPAHGGCDLDDFFVARWRMDEGKHRILITRSPNTRGEYSFWDFVPGDWYPTHTNRKGETSEFPKLTLKTRPKQILQAVVDGDVIYNDLPSRINPPETGEMRRYTRKDCLDDLLAAMLITGGYGQYELAVRALNSLSATKMDKLQIRSEDAVDAFTQGGTPEDREFILDDRKRIIDLIVASGKEVDVALAGRLGVRDLPCTDKGPITKIKAVMQTEVESYEKKLEKFCMSQPTPTWLPELGENAFCAYAAHILRASRRAMFIADQAAMGLEHEDRVKIIRGAQESAWASFFEEYKDRLVRAQFIMSFWYACRTMPTVGGKITDQPVFGTNLFPHAIDALIFFGLAKKPYVDEKGRIMREQLVTYNGCGFWDVTCRVCGATKEEVDLRALNYFWNKKSVCKECRG